MVSDLVKCSLTSSGIIGDILELNWQMLSCSSTGRAWRYQRQDHGFDSQGKQELIKCRNCNVNAM